MNAQLIEIAVSALVALEIGLLAASGFVTARHRGLPVAEAAAYGTMGSLMIASAMLQLSLVLGLTAGLVFELAAAALAVSILVAFRAQLIQLRSLVLVMATRQPGIFAAVALSGGYLAAQAILLPSMATDHVPLDRLAAICKAFSVRLPGSDLSPVALPPLNSAVLPQMILRFGTETGVGVFGFAAYLTLGAATYALARRYAWPPTALTVALVIWSMPRFVLLATSCGFELVPTAAGLVAVLALYRAVEAPPGGDLVMMLFAICFSMSDGPYCLVFPSVLTALTAVVLFRRHGWSYWKESLQGNGGGALVSLALVFLFSQAWLFAANFAAGHPWAGALQSPPLAPTTQGIVEAAANACRYVIQMIHLPVPTGDLFAPNLTRGLEQIYNRHLGLVLEKTIHLPPFAVDWGLASRTSWFGPFAVLLSLPALAYAMIRAPRRLKAVVVATVGYAYLVCLVGAWNGSNVRYFSPFFACSGFVIAFFLPPWRLTRRGKKLLQATAAVLLVHAMLFQADRPLIGWRHLLPAAQSLWRQDTPGMEQSMARAVRKSVWWEAFGKDPVTAENPFPPAARTRQRGGTGNSRSSFLPERKR